MRDNQGAQGVFRDDAAGIADDVRISRFQPRVRMESRVSIQVRTASFARAWGQFAQFMGARVNFVGSEDSSMTLMAKTSLAKPRE